jgi:hypothetical protein
VIARKKADYGIWIVLQDMNKSENDRDPGAAVHRLHKRQGFTSFSEQVAVVSLMIARENTDLPIARDERFDARTRLLKKGAAADDTAELLGS